MDFMNILQNTALWLIILTFLSIGGYELYHRGKQYKAIQDAKHRKLLKQIEKEE